MGASLACGILGVKQAAAKRIHGWLSAFVCFSNATAGSFEALSGLRFRSVSGQNVVREAELAWCAPRSVRAIDR